jgi:hypothetical protein
MITLRITEKEKDAIKCMIQYFLVNNNGFITRYHKRITQKELENLDYKIGES